MKKYQVLLEWVCQGIVEVTAKDEDDAMEKIMEELNYNMVNEIIAKGEYSKGSMSAVEAWEKDE